MYIFYFLENKPLSSSFTSKYVLYYKVLLEVSYINGDREGEFDQLQKEENIFFFKKNLLRELNSVIQYNSNNIFI